MKLDNHYEAKKQSNIFPLLKKKLSLKTDAQRLRNVVE